MGGVYVTVRVGEERYAFPVERVVEVGEIGELTPVPGAPAWTLGLRNLRGEVLPVCDLAVALGLPPTEATLLAVVDDGARRAGLAIDEVEDVGELPQAAAGPDTPLLSGTAVTGDGLVGIVDVARLLDSLQEARAA